MQLRPVKASGWFAAIQPEDRDGLMQTGIVPVNDVFYELWQKISNIWLLYGGRGGGKSESVFDRLINNCLHDKYFKCLYGRKVFDTVRGSCFATLVASMRKMNVAHLFSFSDADTSTMIVRCKKNGNIFIPFGADKAEKLKSFKDPTHLLLEEFDQFTLPDFQDLYPMLRTIKANCEFLGMFNTKDVFPDHWIMQIFFPELYAGENKLNYNPIAGANVTKIFANYYDNHFINQEAYYNQLRLAAAGNNRILEALANGAWGVIENENPWLYNFDYDKHVKAAPWLPQMPVYLSFDINADPIACTAYQFSSFLGHSQAFIHVINEFGGHMKVEDICQRIKTTYPQTIFFVTGDRSGQNEDVGRNQTVYQMIQSFLGLSDRQMNLNTHNLEHPDSRVLCNCMFYHYPRLVIDPKCKTLIDDCQKAKSDIKCPRPSQLYKNRQDGYKMDYFDSMRYFFQTYFNDFAKKAYFGILK